MTYRSTSATSRQRSCRSASSRRARAGTSATSTGACSSTARATRARAALARRARHERRPDRHLRSAASAASSRRSRRRRRSTTCRSATATARGRGSAATRRERCGERRGPRRSRTGCWSGPRRTPTSRRRCRSSRFRSRASAARARSTEVWEDFLQYASRSRSWRSRAQEAEGRARRSRASATRRSGPRSSGGSRVAGADLQGIREAEIETLLSVAGRGRRRPAGRRLLRADRRDARPGSRRSTGSIERVVLVHRLREVIAQVGFTRFEAAVPDVNGELELDVERARSVAEPAVAAGRREPRRGRLPRASDARPIEAWLERPAVKAARRQLARGLRGVEEGPSGASSARSRACRT